MRENDITQNDELGSTSERKFWKLLAIISLIFIGLMAVVVKLFIVQIIDADKYQKIAKEQQEKPVTIRGKRGEIFDSQGRLLSSTINSYSFAIRPGLMRKANKTDTIKAILKKYFSISDSAFDSRFLNNKSKFVWVKRALPIEDYTAFVSLNVQGLIKLPEPKRHYFYPEAGAQIIGSTNIDNIGRNGIEQTYDKLLRGDSINIIMLKDAYGKRRPTIESFWELNNAGTSIALTIDIELQRIVEEELRIGVLDNKANSGTAIAINPKTGEILAMASYPSYDPNNVYQQSTENMRIRAITDTYEPGSTFKMITAAAALEEGAITPVDTVDGKQGQLNIGAFTITDDHPVGKITFAEAMERSSNVVFATVANKLEKNILRKYIRDFGFGNKLGFDVTGEVPGKLKNASDFDPTTKYTMGYGYGLAVTPLQIAMAYCAVANGGKLMKPYILKNTYDESGKIDQVFKPTFIRKVISKETVDTLTSMLCKVVEGKHGTASAAKINKLRIAGKTGTSRKYVDGKYGSGAYVASFVGFFPADNPEITILVLIDNPKTSIYGGIVAAPVFKRIALKAISTCPYLFENTTFLPNADSFAKDSSIIPSLIGMNSIEATVLLEKIGLKSNIQTHSKPSLIIAQTPPPYTKIAKSAIINVKTLKPNAKYEDIKQIDLKGLSSRRAISIVQAAGCYLKLAGSGTVVSYSWKKEIKGAWICIIHCK